MSRVPIKDFYNRILGYIEEKPNGDKVAYDFYNRILGTYYKSQNVTKDFYNRIIARGDVTSGLVYNAKNK